MPAVDPDAKIPCGTPQALERELEYLSSILSLGEKEDTWEKMEKALIRFAGVTRGGGYKHMPLYVDGVGRKGSGLQIVACMMSDRGRLSGVATELLQTLAPRLGLSFAPLVTLYLEPLVTLLGRPNKVFLKRAEKCLATIISHCQLLAILPPLRKGLNDEAGTCRRGCAVGFQRIINEWDRDVLGDKGVMIVEDALRKMATDKDAEVRKIGKSVWGRYTDVWPERVEDFSAPLTPTIRRYLDIPANGMPARPKARPPPVVPKVAPPQPTSLASSTRSASPPPRAANPRVQALATKAIRLPPYIPPASVEPEKPVAGPSRRQVSPRKAMDALPRPPPPQHADTEPPRLAKSSSSANLRAEASMPFKINQGRSVSHAILPSAASATSLSSLPETINPLSRPVRPMLPPSFSSLSLPPDPLDALGGPKRVPSALRLPAMMGSESVEEEDDPIFVTPAPLRGAARLQNPMIQARKMMGQAQRIVQPPPSESRPMLGAPTPVASRTVSRSVRDRVQDLEKASTPTKVEPSEVPLPLSPIASKNSPPGVRMLSVASPLGKKTAEMPVSPMLPILSQSTSTKEEAEMSSTELLKVEMGDGLVDQTVVQANISTDSSVSRNPESAPIFHEEAFVEAVSPQHVDEASTAPVVATVPTPVEAPLMSPSPIFTSDEAPTQSKALAGSDQTVDAPMAEPEKAPAAQDKSEMTSTTDKKKANPVLSSSTTSRAATAVFTKPMAKASTKTEVKLPSVAAKLPGRRIVTAPERRPFKPTSQAPSAPQQSRLTAPTAATAARAAAATKASTKAEDVIRQAPKAVESHKPAPATDVVFAPKAPVARVVSGGAFAAPTKASASRNTVPTTTATMAPPPKVATKVVLPPVKKEKVRLKAALPKFVPVRGGARGASDSSAKLAESTSSVSSVSAAERKPGVIRAKVKPEMVALPSSPVDTKTTNDNAISPTAYTFKEGVVARVKKILPETVPLPASPATAATPTAAAIPLPESPLLAKQALPEQVPLPPSPLASMSALPSVADDVASPVSTRSHQFAVANAMAAHTPISKASTAATAPSYDTDTDESDDEEGVTFKHSGGQIDRTQPKPKPAAVLIEGDLMEFSAPSRTSKAAGAENEIEIGREGKKGSTTPKSSPSRQALRLRDANTPRSGREEVF